MALDKDVDQLAGAEGATVETSTEVAATAKTTAVATAAPAVGVTEFFQTVAERDVMDIDATVPFTIIGSEVSFGEDMEHSGIDGIVMMLSVYKPYQKLDLGVGNPSDEQKKLQLNSHDGTVTFDEVVYSQEDYLDMMKSQGFDKAKWKDRGMIQGLFLSCDKFDDLDDKVKATIHRKPMTVYLSPTSNKAYRSMITREAMGDAASVQFGEAVKPILGLKLTKLNRKGSGSIRWSEFHFETVRG